MEKGLKDLFQRMAGQTGKPGSVDIAIETPRLVLREIELSDKQRLIEISNTPGFAHYCFDGSEEKVDDFLKKCLNSRKADPATGLREYIMLAICEKDTGLFLGSVSLERKSFLPGMDYEINFFMDASQQNKGYAREAAVNMQYYAFMVMNLPGINVTIEPRNGPSLHVAGKEGYSDTGETVDIDTPCFGTRVFKILAKEKQRFESDMNSGMYDTLMIKPAPANDNTAEAPKQKKPGNHKPG